MCQSSATARSKAEKCNIGKARYRPLLGTMISARKLRFYWLKVLLEFTSNGACVRRTNSAVSERQRPNLVRTKVKPPFALIMTSKAFFVCDNNRRCNLQYDS